MYEKLGAEKLKDGEVVELGVVTAPDAEWAEPLKPFLAHKGEPWNSQVEATLEKNLAPLETKFFIVSAGAEDIYATVCTWKSGGAANLGHVYTAPEHRRNGAASMLMKAALDDFRKCGGEAMYLGTGFDTPPFHIYETWGFRGVFPGTGFMEYYPAGRDAFLERHFAPQNSGAVELKWHHWPRTIALLGQQKGGIVRLAGERVLGRVNYESYFVRLQYTRANTGKKAYVLEGTQTGCAGAMALTGPDDRLGAGVMMLDVFAHPNFAVALPELVEKATAGVDGKLIAYVDSSYRERLDAMAEAGFAEEARVRDVVVSPPGMSDEGAKHDLVIVTRE